MDLRRLVKTSMGDKIESVEVLLEHLTQAKTPRRGKKCAMGALTGSGKPVKTSKKCKAASLGVLPGSGKLAKTPKEGKKAPVGVPPGFEWREKTSRK